MPETPRSKLQYERNETMCVLIVHPRFILIDKEISFVYYINAGILG